MARNRIGDKKRTKKLIHKYILEIRDENTFEEKLSWRLSRLNVLFFTLIGVSVIVGLILFLLNFTMFNTFHIQKNVLNWCLWVVITCLLFYYAFLSEDKIKVDFSLEQMFPDNDPDKEKYDSFREKFSREDDSMLLIYVPPTNHLNIQSLAIVDSMVYQFKEIKDNSNCVSIQNFPCSSIDYYNIDNSNQNERAQFIDYDKKSREK